MHSRRRLFTLPFIGLFAVACSSAGAASGPGLEVGSTPAPAEAGISGTPGAELLLAGLSTFDAGDAGVVALGLDGGRIVVREVVVDPGWTQQTNQHGDNGVEVRFSGPDGAETRVEADLGSDGTLDVDLRERRAATDDVKTISLLQAGTVTYTVVAGVVSLDFVTASDGWHITERDLEDGLEVDLTNAALLSKVEFLARTNGDRLELETELRVGPGFESSDDDNADAADDGALATPGPTASPSPQPTERPRPTARPTARPTQGAGATETPKATDDDDDDGRETETPEPTDDDDDDDDDNSGPGGGGGSGGGHGSGSGGGDSSGPGGGGGSGGGHGSGSGGGDSSGPGRGGGSGGGSDDD